MPDLDALVQSMLSRCPELQRGRDAVCGVSGGPDSMALLVLAASAGCNVTAVHIDHGLRPGSGEEAVLVEKAANAFGARFRAETVRLEPGPNLEARARSARLRLLGPDAMTGHTMDDQVETMMLNLLRGASINGLSGMGPDRHPLLGVRRAETHELCRMMAIDIVDDPTNRSPTHLRNRVRSELLPLMEQLSGRDLVPVLARQADVWRDDVTLLDSLAAVIDVTDARALAAAPLPLARRAVRAWLTAEHPPDLATVERVLAVAHGHAAACETNDGRRVSRHHQRLSLDASDLG